MIAGGRPGYLAEMRDCGSGDVKANARLIAAAPDLLAALVSVYEDWKTISGIDHGAGDEYEDVRNIDAQARQAIAKATGETP